MPTLIRNLARLKFFKSLLRRVEISQQILEGHQKLTDCLALFQVAAAHGTQDYLSEMNRARAADEESLHHQFLALNANDRAILGKLDVLNNQVEAMLALQTVSHHNDAILGQGGFGVVKKGTWGKIDIAVKELGKETDLKQLVKEIEGISDFGLSKIKQYATATRCLTRASTATHTSLSAEVAGTLRYMSPEAMKGQISYASDMYAYAMTLYEIFTNEPPFMAVMDYLLFTLIVKEHMRLTQPTDLAILRRGLTTGMWDLIWKASEPDVSCRPDFNVISGITEGLVEEWDHGLQQASTEDGPDDSSNPLALFFEDVTQSPGPLATVMQSGESHTHPMHVVSLARDSLSVRQSSYTTSHLQRMSSSGTLSTPPTLPISPPISPRNPLFNPKVSQLSDFSSKYASDEDGRFIAVTQEQARELAQWCLDVLIRSLRRDPAELNTISETSARGDTMSLELQYACRHWATHVACSQHGDEALLHHIRGFMGRSFILWVEAASGLGIVSKTADLLRQAFAWSLGSRCSKDLACLLNDGYRFLVTHEAVITTNPLHVCRTALPFTPPSTSIYKTYINQTCEAPRVIRGVDAQWPACLTILQKSGHDRSTIRVCVAFSPDGSFFARSNDSTIHVMDTISGKEVRELKGHPSVVTSLAFSFDETRMASACLQELHVWDLSSGVSLKTIQHKLSRCIALAFSPESRRLVTGWEDTMVRVWDIVKSSTLDLTLEGHTKRITSALFSPDGMCIASGSCDATVRLWDAISGSIATLFDGHTKAITSLAFSHDSSRLVSGSEDQTARLWDTASGAAITVVRHPASVCSITFLPRLCIASASLDMKVQVWDSISGAELHTSIIGGSSDSRAITSIAISPNGARVVSVSVERGVRLWDTVKGILIPHPEAHSRLRTSEEGDQGHKTLVRSMAFSNDGSRLGTVSVGGSVCLWDTTHGELIAHSNAGYYGQLSFLPTEHFITWENKAARIWNVRSGELVTILGSNWSSGDMPLPATTMPVHDATPNGQILATAHHENVHVWDVRNGALITKVQLNNGQSIKSVRFSLDGSRLHTTDGQGEGRSYSVQSLTSRLVLSRARKGGAETCESLSITSNEPLRFFMNDRCLMKARTSSMMPEVVCYIPSPFDIAHNPNRDGSCVVMTSKGTHVAIGCADGRVIILDLSAVTNV
ncbi:hypothetical protein FRB96_005888 [Tulasnella sp. 330]|nr:hypothetical protein FRB96_005888 [Tulasnella sp. 330]